MVKDSLETETLARLYLEQGHPERAAPIFERILAEDPGRTPAADGLARCRAALRARAAEECMDRDKKLNFLKRMLSRLTGGAVPEEPAPVEVPGAPAPPMTAAPLPAEPARPPPIPAAPASPRRRKLELLQAMLRRLTEA